MPTIGRVNIDDVFPWEDEYGNEFLSRDYTTKENQRYVERLAESMRPSQSIRRPDAYSVWPACLIVPVIIVTSTYGLRHMRMAARSLGKGDTMKGAFRMGRIWRVLGVVLSGLLVLSVCTTAGFAEQVDITPEEVVADATPDAGAQSTDGDDLGLTAQGTDEGITWTDWTNTESLPTTAGNWRLTSNVTLTSTWQVPTGTTNLHLNGKTITASGDFTAVMMEAINEGTRTLNLYDDESNPGQVTHPEGKSGCGVWVSKGCVFNLHGGSITRNTVNGTNDRMGGGVHVYGGTFNMDGGKISHNVAGNVNDPNASSGSGAGVYVESFNDSSGTFSMTGGTIERNRAAYQGGGVFCTSGGTLNISGGTIQNNHSPSYGGGIYYAYHDTPSFTLSGGTITNNTSNSVGGIFAGSNFNVSGNPVVEGNTKGSNPSAASNIVLDDNGNGAKINVTGALTSGASMGVTYGKAKPYTFTSGYTAKGNTVAPSTYFFSDDTTCNVYWTANEDEARLCTVRTITITNTTPDLGTVTASVNDTTVTQAIAGDTVTLTATPNDSEHYTLDEYSVTSTNDSTQVVNVKWDNTFQMPDHDVTVTASFRERHFHDGIEFKPWKETDPPLPKDPGDYYLTDDVVLTSTWVIPSAGPDVPTNLCLNGHSITLDQDDNKPVMRISKAENGATAKLVLYDNANGGGTITHENGKTGHGVEVVNGGEFVMEGGCISGNVADSESRSGGGVYVGSGATFTMNGGAIQNNTADYGGGVYVGSGATFTMNGGAIQNNGSEETLRGGGVYVGSGASAYGQAGGTFNLAGGTITGNNAAIGGGVLGYWVEESDPAYSITLSGNPRVTDNHNVRPNYDTKGKNLCLAWPKYNESPLGIKDALGENAIIGISVIRDDSAAESAGVSLIYVDGVFTTGYGAAQNDDPWRHFTSDNPKHAVLWTPDGKEAQLTTRRNIAVAQGITGGTVKVSRDFAAEGETITIQATPDEGWDLVSVTAKDAQGNDVAVEGNQKFVVPASDVVVSATFREKPAIHVTYTSHVQKKGDLPAVSDGEDAGTTGESRRLEAMSATVDTGGIEYRAHVQRKGWDGWVANGKQAGTTGESRGIEAIQMRLTGNAAADGYHVWYRVHSQTFGWLGWARDGEPAGTAGMSKRAEAYQVVVLWGNRKPTDYDASKPAYRAQVAANAHLQGLGWTGKTSAGTTGSTGQSRQLEALRLYAPNQPFAGGITYQVHVQGSGWTAKKSDGALAGITGKSRRIEAVRISLTGELADHLSVWYRVHSQTYGWSGWARDGASAGTEGLSKRAEAVDMRILPKNAPAPGSTANAFRTR